MVLPSYQAKKEWLLEMLPILSQVGRTLVFVATRNECEELALIMREKQSLQVETLHGEKHQSDRNASLRAFSNGENTALIATDVAARGLDVQNVSTVVSFDPAKNLDAHVHRIGRAGRLSKDKQNKGVAYTLLTPKNADFAHVLVNAFQREGRDVSSELQALAEKSRRSGNVASRNKWNKSGIGFHDKDPSHDESVTSSGIGYYGPSLSDVEPRAKRSRWG
jgi:ATP-dependent RNA helicase DDX42